MVLFFQVSSPLIINIPSQSHISHPIIFLNCFSSQPLSTLPLLYLQLLFYPRCSQHLTTNLQCSRELSCVASKENSGSRLGGVLTLRLFEKDIPKSKRPANKRWFHKCRCWTYTYISISAYIYTHTHEGSFAKTIQQHEQTNLSLLSSEFSKINQPFINRDRVAKICVVVGMAARSH